MFKTILRSISLAPNNDSSHSLSEKSKQVDEFEENIYTQKFWNLCSQTVSTFRHYQLLNKFKAELGSDLPASYRKIFYELDPEESVILNQFIDDLAVSNTVEVMTVALESFAEVPSVRTHELLELVRSISANKKLFNTQFATDTIATLLDMEDSRIERYNLGVSVLEDIIRKKDKTPDEEKFADDMVEAERAAILEKLPNIQWSMASEMGLGYMTHAGWECCSCPKKEEPSEFFAIRTLGLTRNGKAAFQRVTLDFSVLRKISLEHAKILLKAVDQNVNKEKPDDDELSHLTQQERAIVIQFSKDLYAACLDVHSRLQ